MAVVGTRYQTGFGNVQTLGTAIHAALIARGWTIEFTNTDAAGAGTANNPAWTKTFTPNDTAGFVVYQMPAYGVLNRWFLKIEILWGDVSTSYFVRFTTAQGVNTSTGALVSPGTPYGVSASGSTAMNGDAWLSTWEHGILIGINGGASTSFTGFERRRDFSGNIQDDGVAYLFLSGFNSTGFGSNTNCDNLVRSWPAGERSSQPLAILTGQSTSSLNNARAISTFNQPLGNTGFPMGFYTTSGGLGGMLRLAQLWWATDSNDFASQDIYVDGAPRQYIGYNTALYAPNGQRILLAQN